MKREDNAVETNTRIDGSKDSTQGSWTLNLIIAILLVTSASFSFGYGISASSTKPSDEILTIPDNSSTVFVAKENVSLTNPNITQNPVNNNSTEQENITPTKDEKSITEQILDALPQTVFFIGSMLAAMSTGMWYRLPFVNRRSIFLVNNLILLASVFFALIAIKFTGALYISRFLHGYQGGMACAIVPTFLTEIAPQRIRGKVGFLHQLQITIGIFCAQLFGLPQMFGGFGNKWTLTYLVGAIPSILSLAFYKMLPMSPIELVTRFNDKDSAERVLRKLRNEADVSSDMLLIEQEHQAKQSTSNQMSIVEVIRSRDDRWQLIVAVALLSVQALSGINVVLSFSNLIFKDISLNLTPYLIASTGLFNVLATVGGVVIIEKVGRRSLLLKSNIVIIISHVVLTIINVTKTGKTTSVASLAFAMIFILIFIAAFAVALGPIPFLYSSEITRSESRNAILNIALSFNYFINIIIAIVFICIRQVVGGYVYLMFVFPVFMGTVLFYFKMIETKNKNIEQIESFFNAGRKSNDQESTHVALS